MAAPPNPVRWSKHHLEELERMFPERCTSGTGEELNFRSGTRAVLAHVRQRVKEQDNEMV